jgi:hypothetical protein
MDSILSGSWGGLPLWIILIGVLLLPFGVWGILNVLDLLIGINYAPLLGMRQERKRWQNKAFDSDGIMKVDVVVRIRIHKSKEDILADKRAKGGEITTIKIMRKLDFKFPEPIDVNLPLSTLENIIQPILLTADVRLDSSKPKPSQEHGTKKPWEPF